MRILVQSHSAAPYNFGGAELALVELIDAWQKFDASAEFLIVAPPPEGQLQREMGSRGIDVCTVDFDPTVGVFTGGSSRWSPDESLRALSAVGAIRGAIRDFSADLVVTNTIIAPWAAIAAAAERVPHIWFAHEYGSAEHGLSFRFGRDSTFGDLGSLSDVVVANSAELKDFLSSWVMTGKIEVLHPAIPPAEVRRLAAESPSVAIPEHRHSLMVVCAGRISEAKGQSLLLEALVQLRDEGRDVGAWFVGIIASDYEQEFRGLVESMGLNDRVELVGDLANPFPHVISADVGVALSANESFGRVSLEYMALGRPVIATRTGVARSLIRDGEDGFVITPGSVDDLVTALRTLTDDEGLRSRMGKSAARQAERVHAMHPPELLLPRLVALAGRPSATTPLPHILGSLLDDPELHSRYAASLSDTEQRMRDSATWKVGSAALIPLRAARALMRRLRSGR